MSRRGKSTETESRLVVVRGWGVAEKWGGSAPGYRVSFRGDGLGSIIAMVAQLSGLCALNEFYGM